MKTVIIKALERYIPFTFSGGAVFIVGGTIGMLIDPSLAGLPYIGLGLMMSGLALTMLKIILKGL